MTYLVFSQEHGALPYDKLAAHGGRFFSATLELLEEGDDAIAVRLVGTRPPLRGEFRIASRATTKDDLMNARDAEARGRAAGMAALAERCARVWTIDAANSEMPSEASYLTLAAVCASVALGPVLPPDGSTLFGVRGAIERRDKALLKT
jgi:hypothetical protein